MTTARLPRNLSEFVTTKTLNNAIAAANMGRRPSGRPDKPPYKICPLPARQQNPESLVAVAFGGDIVRADPACLAQVLDLKPVVRAGDGWRCAKIDAHDASGGPLAEIEDIAGADRAISECRCLIGIFGDKVRVGCGGRLGRRCGWRLAGHKHDRSVAVKLGAGFAIGSPVAVHPNESARAVGGVQQKQGAVASKADFRLQFQGRPDVDSGHGGRPDGRIADGSA